MRKILLVVFLSFCLFCGCFDVDSSVSAGGSGSSPVLTQDIIDIAFRASHVVNTGMGYIDDYYAGVETQWYKPSDVERSDDGTYTFNYFTLSGFGIISGTAYRASWLHDGNRYPVVVCDLDYVWTSHTLGAPPMVIVHSRDYDGVYHLYKIVYDGVTLLDD